MDLALKTSDGNREIHGLYCSRRRFEAAMKSSPQSFEKNLLDVLEAHQGLVYPLVNSHSYGKSPFFMGKLTISMVIFNSYVKLPEGKQYLW